MSSVRGTSPQRIAAPRPKRMSISGFTDTDFVKPSMGTSTSSTSMTATPTSTTTPTGWQTPGMTSSDHLPPRWEKSSSSTSLSSTSSISSGTLRPSLKSLSIETHRRTFSKTMDIVEDAADSERKHAEAALSPDDPSREVLAIFSGARTPGFSGPSSPENDPRGSFECLSPPTRGHNPVVLDSRFCGHLLRVSPSDRRRRVSEGGAGGTGSATSGSALLGLLSVSPPPFQDHLGWTPSAHEGLSPTARRTYSTSPAP